MKIVIILILLTSLVFCTGCEVAQSEPTVSSPNVAASSIEERVANLEKIVEELQGELGLQRYKPSYENTLLERVEVLEEKVISSGFYESSNYPQSLEARVKSLEQKVLTSSSHGLEDKISKLERRISELEQEVGITTWR